MLLLISGYRWLGSRVVSVLDSNAAGQGRSQGWAWGLKPPKRNPSPPPNEFQPMKYPGPAKSAQMYGGIGLTAGNKPTYG